MITIAKERKEYQPIVDTSDLERKSIEICKEFQNKDKDRITILAFSGGKDSILAYMMAAKSGIKFKPVYSPTSVDPPELIYYIRNIFNPWVKSKGYPEVIFQKYNTWKTGPNKGKIKTMWSLIGNRAMPPTRICRYCCDELKERTGSTGDTVFTGVRWEESKKRSEQQMVNFYKGKIMVRPIVFWKEIEIWSYIIENDIPYCELYDNGWNRLGCIGCPLGSNQKKELNMYPAYANNYIRSFERMLEYRRLKGKETIWETGLEVYKWWIGECEVLRKEIDGQCSMF